VPTFCRHNRFIERCPICSRTIAGADAPNEPRERASGRGERGRAGASRPGAPARRSARAEEVRVRRHERASADGYASALLPGVHASADAERLAVEIAFSAARIALLSSEPPDLYGEIFALAQHDVEAATRACFLVAYVCPSEGEQPFAAIRAAIADPASTLGDLSIEQLGPRTSHDPARGAQTLRAYERMIEQGGGARAAFAGDDSWAATRRFERLFERLALPGLSRTARYDLLVMLGALRIHDVEADSLHLGVVRGAAMNDATTLAAKRIFAIGDAINLERRCAALASALAVHVGVLDLALWNFSSPQRATLGFAPEIRDSAAYTRAHAALGL
jgi:hypothetical protein